MRSAVLGGKPWAGRSGSRGARPAGGGRGWWPRPAQAPMEVAPKAVRAVHAPGDGDRDVIIAVDAGHGGEDPGAIGHGGTREKDVTLAIARALAERINAEAGMHAVLTRDRDEFLELRDRIARARAAHADLFISVHADSIGDRGVSGASVYVLSVHGASSEAARWLAERENSADLVGAARGPDQVSRVLTLRKPAGRLAGSAVDRQHVHRGAGDAAVADPVGMHGNEQVGARGARPRDTVAQL